MKEAYNWSFYIIIEDGFDVVKTKSSDNMPY